MLTSNLTPEEEIRVLRVHWQHCTDILKDSTDLPATIILEKTALQSYIEVRIANLRKLLEK